MKKRRKGRERRRRRRVGNLDEERDGRKTEGGEWTVKMEWSGKRGMEIGGYQGMKREADGKMAGRLNFITRR